MTSQIAYLQMQLEEKRRHIEAEKYRAQAEWEDQRRRLGQTAFWYVIGKAQGNQNVREGTGSEVRNLATFVCLFVVFFSFLKNMIVLITHEKQVESDTKSGAPTEETKQWAFLANPALFQFGYIAVLD